MLSLLLSLLIFQRAHGFSQVRPKVPFDSSLMVAADVEWKSTIQSSSSSPPPMIPNDLLPFWSWAEEIWEDLKEFPDGMTIKTATGVDLSVAMSKTTSDHARALAGDKTIGQRRKWLLESVNGDSEHDTNLVIASDRGSIGFLGLREDCDIMCIEYLDETLRDYLIKYAVWHAQTRGSRELRWSVDSRNLAGMAFSVGEGAEIVGAEGEHRHIMSLKLK